MNNIQSRNYGIDILRCVSMLMVVLLHTIGHGGLLDNVELGSARYFSVWFLEIAAYCAVDVFAMITGYVMVSGKFNGFKIIPLWLTVFFYSAGVTVLFYIIPVLAQIQKPSVKEIILRCIPVCTDQYWYFTKYVGIFFFIPFVNKMLKGLDKKSHAKLCMIIIVLFSILPLFILNKIDIFSLGGGYTSVWLLCMYIIGAYIKLYPIEIKKRTALFLYFAIVLFSVIGNCITKRFTNTAFFYGYTSIFTIASGVMLLILFSQIDINNRNVQKIILLLGNLSFSVYLIHEQPLIRDNFIEKQFVHYVESNAFVLFFKILGTALLIFTVCIVIDFIRFEIFKLLKINKIPKFCMEKLCINQKK